MNLPQPTEQNVFFTQLEASSLVSLLERGLQYAKQGRYAEGVALFALARERLPSHHSQLIDTLDIFIKDYIHYWQAQQAIQQASKYFIQVETAQRDNTATLEKLLPVLIKDIHNGMISESPSLVDQQAVHQLTQFLETHAQEEHVSSLPSPHPELLPQNSTTLAPLHFTCFGCFEVRRNGQPVILCSNRNGQAILRYLIAQPEHRATMDILMTVLWPDDEQEVAHHKLQVAVSALRRSLNSGYECSSGGGYILCKQGSYQLNPSIALHSDVDEFIALYHAGQRATGGTALSLYEQACALYTGPFLPEDLYFDWSSLQREQLSRIYLKMCGLLVEHYVEAGKYELAITWATAILKENRCDEDAHRHLMRAYVAQGQRGEALRQYHRCQQILSQELGIEPMAETNNLFYSLLKSDTA